jgi:hypothetical protein
MNPKFNLIGLATFLALSVSAAMPAQAAAPSGCEDQGPVQLCRSDENTVGRSYNITYTGSLKPGKAPLWIATRINGYTVEQQLSDRGTAKFGLERWVYANGGVVEIWIHDDNGNFDTVGGYQKNYVFAL